MSLVYPNLLFKDFLNRACGIETYKGNYSITFINTEAKLHNFLIDCPVVVSSVGSTVLLLSPVMKACCSSPFGEVSRVVSSLEFSSIIIVVVASIAIVSCNLFDLALLRLYANLDRGKPCPFSILLEEDGSLASSRLRAGATSPSCIATGGLLGVLFSLLAAISS